MKNFIVYRSSAGSGKTFTLVKEYLKLCLSSKQPDYFKHILAITFTNKAADEMKERIVESIKAFSTHQPEGKYKVMFNAVLSEISISKEEAFERSTNIHKALLHKYAYLSISTIDKFFSQIVRSFSFDLHLPFHFDIEIDEKALLEKVTDSLLDKAGNNDEFTTTLVEFTLSNISEDSSWDSEQLLKNTSTLLLKDSFDDYIKQLISIDKESFDKAEKSVYEFIKKFEAFAISKAIEALNVVKKYEVSLDDFYQKKSGIAAKLVNISEKNFDNYSNSYVLASLNEDKWLPSKPSADVQAKMEAAVPYLKPICIELFNYLDANYTMYQIAKMVASSIKGLKVVKEIKETLDEIKRENNIVHISDFNRLINEVVIEQPIPFFYERIGEKYNHFLIDEFQDTSELQFQNLLPLLENSLAEGHYNLVVGDAKQSIYRFRDAKVEQFVQLPDITSDKENIVEKVQILEENYTTKALDKNFRSASQIIQFNNNLFESLVLQTAYQSFSKYYEEIKQSYDETKSDGYVVVKFLSKEDEFEEQLINYAYNVVEEAIADGFALSDIAILVSKNKECSLLYEALMAKGINCVSEESLRLDTDIEVKTLISVLLYMEDKSKENAFSMLSAFHQKGSLIEHPITFTEKVKEGKDAFAILKSQDVKLSEEFLRRLPVYERTEELIRVLAIQANPFVGTFLNELIDFSTNKRYQNLSIKKWWSQIREKKVSGSATQNDAVQLMTIHKSKGLQFPVVLSVCHSSKSNFPKYFFAENKIPELHSLPVNLLKYTSVLESSPYQQEYQHEKQSNDLDELNKYYVAFTRPEKRLYCLADEPKKGSNFYDLFGNYVLDNLIESDGAYISGKRVKHAKPVKQDDSAVLLNSFISNAFTDKLKMSFQSEKHWSFDEERSKREYGNLIHTILQSVNSLEDVDIIIEQLLLAGKIESVEAEKLSSGIKHLIQSPEAAPFFHFEAAKILTERDIISSDNEIKRPDKVVIFDDKLLLIDFKTSFFDPKHQKQIVSYKQLLNDMGYSNVEAYLLYTGDVFQKDKPSVISC